MSTPSWLEDGSSHIWLPYSQMKTALPPLPAVSTKDCTITLDGGRELVDGIASWWTACHGYNHPHVIEAMKKQLDVMPHVMFGGLNHEPALKLAKRLANMLPGDLNRVFFTDSGSVSVEVAIKMAIQYWHARGNGNKSRLLTVSSGYHGDTFGAMSVCDPITGMHKIFKDVLPSHYFAEAPLCGYADKWDDKYIENFKNLIETHHKKIVAVILEPIVQGAGGMRIYSPEFLKSVRSLCDEYDVLLILDEIATGFGRTVTMFACEHADITPDIMCVGKALTGGYMSLAATLTTTKVSDTISLGDPGVFMHGPTFMGNPLACNIAAASINLLKSQNWQNAVVVIEDQLLKVLAPFSEIPGVTDIRVLGAIGVMEMDYPVDVARAQQHFVERGVWIRPFGKLIYIMPPYIIKPHELSRLTEAMGSFAQIMAGK